jgi:hypothetical protein
MKIIDLKNKGKECLAIASNLAELTKKFYIILDEKYTMGWIWACKRCDTICYSEEFLCPTSGKWISRRIVCRGCGQRWTARQPELAQTEEGTWEEV